MLDVTGNNIANVSTTAYKASQVTFSDTLSSTMREATQSTATAGGTDPLQVGSGVQVANITTNTTQGTLTSTGQPLDMAIQGQGYFVVNNGSGDLYTRAGSFSVDSQNYLVDTATGYRVQRTGTTGVADGFQNAANTGIQIPYNTAIPANATSNVTLAGNLSANDDTTATTNVLTSTTPLLDTTGAAATDATELANIKGATIAAGDTFTLTGVLPDGSYVGGTWALSSARLTTPTPAARQRSPTARSPSPTTPPVTARPR
jgi:flagellar hook protein FlgE